MPFDTKHRIQPSITVDLTGVVVVEGAVSGMHAGQLRRSAIDAIDTASAHRPVVIDLERCTALDDGALVALICADHHAIRSGRVLVLRRPSRSVLGTIRSLAASLLPLVEEALPSPAGRPLTLVLDTESPCPPSCDGSVCGGSCPAGLALARRRGRLARWRDPLRRPSRPPMGESA